MPVYVWLALGAAAAFSLNAVWSKIASKQAMTDRNAFIFYFYILSLPFLLLIPWLTRIQNPWPGIVPLLIFSATFFVGNFFILTVLFRYDISVLHPFFHFQSIFSVLLAFFVLGEVFPTQAYLWISLIIAGGVLVGMNEQFRPQALLTKNFLLFLTGIFFFAISDIFARKTMAFMDYYNLKFWSSLVLAVLAVILIPAAGQHLKVSSTQLKPLFLSTFFFFVATLLLFNAFSYNITISQPLAMLGSLFTLLISIVLARLKPDLLEHQPTKVYAVRTAGVALMVLSAIMLARLS